MAKQPSYRPLEASEFFTDGRSARPLVAGTVARGQLNADMHFFTGKGDEQQQWYRAAVVVGSVGGNGWAALAPTMLRPEELHASRFPFPITRAVLERGRERYTIFCAICHDPVGNGNGKIVERGFTRPPSFHSDLSRGFKLKGEAIRLRDAPVGYYFDVITNGFGAMPDYASQVKTRDRWAIIAYIRALQYSQRAELKDLPKDERERFTRGDRQ